MDSWDSWVRIFRDAAIVVVGAFILIYETVFVMSPSPELIGAGLLLLGLPPALRLDHGSRRERRKDDES